VSARLGQRRFTDELPELLRARGLSQRELARRIGIQPSHLSRLLRAKDYKRPSVSLIAAVASALDLPPERWPEWREGYVIERIVTDPACRDQLFRRLRKS
jgi:transcriptional regulator with XRE-family HTH domain